MQEKQNIKLSKLGFKPKWNKDTDYLAKEIKFHLTDNILGWGMYYVDTLMENALEYLEGRNLCTHGGDNTVILNMKEFVEFVLKNRWDIERDLRGQN